MLERAYIAPLGETMSQAERKHYDVIDVLPEWQRRQEFMAPTNSLLEGIVFGRRVAANINGAIRETKEAFELSAAIVETRGSAKFSATPYRYCH